MKQTKALGESLLRSPDSFLPPPSLLFPRLEAQLCQHIPYFQWGLVGCLSGAFSHSSQRRRALFPGSEEGGRCHLTAHRPSLFNSTVCPQLRKVTGSLLPDWQVAALCTKDLEPQPGRLQEASSPSPPAAAQGLRLLPLCFLSLCVLRQDTAKYQGMAKTWED